MHRCSVTAVGTDDFPTFIPSCYSYCQCRKLYYSIGDGFIERVEKYFFFFHCYHVQPWIWTLVEFYQCWCATWNLSSIPFSTFIPHFTLFPVFPFFLCCQVAFPCPFFPLLWGDRWFFYQARMTPSCGSVYLLKYQQVPLLSLCTFHQCWPSVQILC